MDDLRIIHVHVLRPIADAPAQTLSVGALFAGQVDDYGLMESSFRGLERARTEQKVRTRRVQVLEAFDGPELAAPV